LKGGNYSKEETIRMHDFFRIVSKSKVKRPFTIIIFKFSVRI
jgi:hypothetical protein